jgi:hypothetical protein
MHNCIVLGCGRSGTSMIAGTLAKCGYFMGENLYPSRASNPKGFFEDAEINRINEAILALVVPKRPPLLGSWLFRDRPLLFQRWLARVPLGTKIVFTPEIINRIKKIIEMEPFCFKDPRFSYTLPVWRPFLRNTVFICVFRDPASTTLSILKECKNAIYLQTLKIDFPEALDVWTLMYEHILQIHINEGKWLFIHFNQMFDEEHLKRLEYFVESEVDHSFPDATLLRSVSDQRVNNKARKIYDRLCMLAAYDEK